MNIRAAIILLVMSVLTCGAVVSILVLSLLIGRERATYRVEWLMQSLLEWLSKEGRFCRRGAQDSPTSSPKRTST
jgi:hypothetical protein